MILQRKSRSLVYMKNFPHIRFIIRYKVDLKSPGFFNSSGIRLIRRKALLIRRKALLIRRKALLIRRKTLFIFLIITISIFVRLLLIVLRQHPGGDEIWAVFLAQSSFKSIWLATLADLHGPFYFLFLHTLDLILPFHLNVFSLRIISLVFGIIASFGMWYLGNLILGKKFALICFILSLFLPAFIFASIFARYYSLLILLSVATIIDFVFFIKRGQIKYLILLIVLSTIGVYTHYYFVLLPVSFMAFLMLSKKYKKMISSGIFSLVSLAILFAPGLYYLITLPKPELIGRHANHILKLPALVTTNIISGETLVLLYLLGNPYVYLPIIIILSLLTIVLLINGLRGIRGELFWLFFSIIFVPSVAIIIFAYSIVPLFALGPLLIFSPALVVVIARGLEFELKKSNILPLAFGLSIFASLILFFYTSQVYAVLRADFRFFINSFDDGDIVLHSHIGSFLIASHYVGREANFEIFDTGSATAQTSAGVGYKKTSVLDLPTQGGRIWYFESPLMTLEQANYVKAGLDKYLTLIYAQSFPKKGNEFKVDYYNVYLYSR